MSILGIVSLFSPARGVGHRFYQGRYRRSLRLRRSHPEGREASRSSCAGIDEVRVGDQSQGGQGTRPRSTADALAPRRRGYRLDLASAHVYCCICLRPVMARSRPPYGCYRMSSGPRCGRTLWAPHDPSTDLGPVDRLRNPRHPPLTDPCQFDMLPCGPSVPLSFPKIISARSDDAIRTRLVW